MCRDGGGGWLWVAQGLFWKVTCVCLYLCFPYCVMSFDWDVVTSVISQQPFEESCPEESFSLQPSHKHVAVSSSSGRFKNKRASGFRSLHVTHRQILCKKCHYLGSNTSIAQLSESSIVRRVRKIAKSDCVCLSVCQSFLPHGITGLPKDGYLSLFRKAAEKIWFSLKSDKNNEYFTWRRFKIYYNYLRLVSFLIKEMETLLGDEDPVMNEWILFSLYIFDLPHTSCRQK